VSNGNLNLWSLLFFPTSCWLFATRFLLPGSFWKPPISNKKIKYHPYLNSRPSAHEYTALAVRPSRLSMARKHWRKKFIWVPTTSAKTACAYALAKNFFQLIKQYMFQKTKLLLKLFSNELELCLYLYWSYLHLIERKFDIFCWIKSFVAGSANFLSAAYKYFRITFPKSKHWGITLLAFAFERVSHQQWQTWWCCFCD